MKKKYSTLKKDDLIILSSFFPYSKSTGEFAKLAHELGLPIVLLSDSEYSPLSSYASLVLKIPRENILFTTSISALTVLLNAIATEIALKKKETLGQSLKEMDRKLRPFYL